MIVDTRPLVDITQEAIKILLQKLGAVNTIRFLKSIIMNKKTKTQANMKTDAEIKLKASSELVVLSHMLDI